MSKQFNLAFALVLLGLAGCTSSPKEERVNHVVTGSQPQRCGSLPTFAKDVNHLISTQVQLLLQQLSAGAKRDLTSCDALKTGLALSQISGSVETDDKAMAMLQASIDGSLLTTGEREFVELVQLQLVQRRKLRLELSDVESKLIAEQASTEKMSSHLQELQHKLDQLLQIEEEIAETEQTLVPIPANEVTAQPKTAGEDQAAPEN